MSVQVVDFVCDEACYPMLEDGDLFLAADVGVFDVDEVRTRGLPTDIEEAQAPLVPFVGVHA